MVSDLENTPASFQRDRDVVLTKHKWQTSLVNLEYLVIYSIIIENHTYHVDDVLTSLKHTDTTFKIAECKFLTTEVKNLGYIIKPGELKIDHVHTAALREAIPPTNKLELRFFSGLCNNYRRFVDSFAHKAGCPHKLLENSSPKCSLSTTTNSGPFDNQSMSYSPRPPWHALNLDHRISLTQTHHHTDPAASSTRPLQRGTDTHSDNGRHP